MKPKKNSSTLRSETTEKESTKNTWDTKEFEDLKNMYGEIENINLYQQGKEDVLSIIKQYNSLCEQVESINNDYADLSILEINANAEYDSFKRSFTKIVEDAVLVEKCFFAMPLLDEYDQNSQWDNAWCDVIGEALLQENRENMRLFINGKLNNLVFTLPNDIYAYKIDESKTESVDNGVLKLARSFASKMLQMFKYISALSSTLRPPMLKLISRKPYEIPNVIELPSEDELNKDLEFLRSLLTSTEVTIEKLMEKSHIVAKYNMLNLPDEIKSGSYEMFTAKARELYQMVQEQRDNYEFLRKLVYNKSLSDLYKLYDSLNKCRDDFSLAEEKIASTDIHSIDYCRQYILMIFKQLTLIEQYIATTVGVKPILIEVGVDFNMYDINLYEVLVAEDCPTEELRQCVSSIIETGFAKYDEYGNVVYIAKPARVSVYRNTVTQLD